MGRRHGGRGAAVYGYFTVKPSSPAAVIAFVAACGRGCGAAAAHLACHTGPVARPYGRFRQPVWPVPRACLVGCEGCRRARFGAVWQLLRRFLRPPACGRGRRCGLMRWRTACCLSRPRMANLRARGVLWLEAPSSAALLSGYFAVAGLPHAPRQPLLPRARVGKKPRGEGRNVDFLHELCTPNQVSITKKWRVCRPAGRLYGFI